MSIRIKILFGTISVLIFAIGINTFFFKKSTEEIQRKISVNLLRINEGANSELYNQITNYKRIANSISYTLLKVINIEEFFRRQLEEYFEFKEIYYTTLRGKVISHFPYNPTNEELDFSKFSYWRKAISKQMVTVSSVNKDFGYPAVIITSPVFIEYGEGMTRELQGMLSIVIPEDKLFFLLYSNSYEELEPSLIDLKGNILSHKDKEVLLNETIDNFFESKFVLSRFKTNLKNISDDEIKWFRYNEDNVEYFLTFSRITGMPWYLVFKGKMHLYTQNIENLSSQAFSTLIISVIFAIIVLYTLVSFIVNRPVELLIKSMNDVKEGYYGKQVYLKQKDEIGDLAKSFNYMSQNLALSQKEIYESEERFRLLTETNPHGILVHKKGQLIDVNQTFLDMTGYNADEVLHSNVLRFASKESLEQIKGNMLSKTMKSYEVFLIRKDGSKFPAEIISQQASYHGEEIRIATVIDISERKKMELLRESVERIARHDLKNPLNAILGFAHIISRMELTEKLEKFIASIRQNAFHMLYMIDHSFDLFKMEQGTYVFKPIKVNLIQLFKKLDEEFITLFKNINVKTEFYLNDKKLDWNESYYIDGEPIHLERLFSNLIKNAIEASQTGDTVQIHIYEEDYRELDESYIIVDIANKLSIPKDIRDRFFDRYITSGKEGGTGLGTYSAMLIAKNHKGDIWFTTSEEEGTHLLIKLPVSHVNSNIGSFFIQN